MQSSRKIDVDTIGYNKPPKSFFQRVREWVANHPIITGVIVGLVIGLCVFIPPVGGAIGIIAGTALASNFIILGAAVVGGAFLGLMAKGISALRDKYRSIKTRKDTKLANPSNKKKQSLSTEIIRRNPVATPSVASSGPSATPMSFQQVLTTMGKLSDAAKIAEGSINDPELAESKHEQLGFLLGEFLGKIKELDFYLREDNLGEPELTKSLQPLAALSLLEAPPKNQDIPNLLAKLEEISPSIASALRLTYEIRMNVAELLNTEEILIDDYTKIINNQGHLLQAIKKYNALTTTNSKINEQFYEQLLNNYYHKKVVNNLQFNYTQYRDFAHDILAAPMILSQILIGGDFMNYYEHQLLPWILHYPKFNQPFNQIEILHSKAKIQLTKEELEAVKLVTQKGSGAFQRLGRYHLLIGELQNRYKALEEKQILPKNHFQLALITLGEVFSFIGTKNKSTQDAIDVLNSPTSAYEKLTNFINQLKDLLKDQPFYKRHGLFTNQQDKILFQYIQQLRNKMLEKQIFLQEIIKDKNSDLNDVSSKVFDQLLELTQEVEKTIQQTEDAYEKALQPWSQADIKDLPLYKICQQFKSTFKLFKIETLEELRTLERAEFR